MKKVVLHGNLGKKFGKEHDIDISTPAQCMDALDSMFDGFKKYIIDCAEQGVNYGIKNDKQKFIECDHFDLRNKTKCFHLMPAPQGGLGFLGSVLVSAGKIYLALWLEDLFKVPEPKTGKTIESESYLYSGPETIEAQGGVIPVGYGRLRVGPKLISSNILNYDMIWNAER